MKTFSIFLLIVFIVALVSSIWIDYFESVREDNRRAKDENSRLIDDLAKAKAETYKARKELARVYAEIGRRAR